MLLIALLLATCAHKHVQLDAGFTHAASAGERIRVLELYPGVTATLVAPAKLDADKRVDLILYALPNLSLIHI